MASPRESSFAVGSSQEPALAGSNRCPRCRGEIELGDIHIGEGVGLCRACNQLFRLQDIALVADESALLDAARSAPPKGCWVIDNGAEYVVGASHRSVGRVLATLAICLFWNCIVSIFVLIAIAETLMLTVGSVPSWFPAPISTGGSRSAFSVGMTVFHWLFLTPFILFGIVSIGMVLMSLGGRTEVRIRDDSGTIFTGVGPVGWTRPFTRSRLSRVMIEDKRWRDSEGSDRRTQQILIDADTVLRFGSGLAEERRRFLAGTLLLRLRPNSAES